jgi:hypothetical protein
MTDFTPAPQQKNMKPMKHISTLCLLAIIAITFNACFKFDDPPKREPVILERTHTIEELKAMHKGSPLFITDDIIIEGVVTTSDQAGNFFMSLFIQDSTGGIEIKVGRSGLYNFYKLGQTLYIKCKGLQLGNNNGMIDLGYEDRNANPRYGAGRIESLYLINRHIFAGPQGNPPAPKTVTIENITPDILGTLVRIENLTFVETSFATPINPPTGLTFPQDTIRTWALPNAPADWVPVPANALWSPRTVNQRFTDGTSSGMFLVRSSGFSRFAGDAIPRTPVTMVGIVTVYGNDYQFFLRDLNDVH